jgi:hypothetical protein
MKDGDQVSTGESPHWTAVLLGRVAERICHSAKNPCPDESCKLRYYCRCAQEQERTARMLEFTLCGSMAACGGGLIVYWLLVK